MFQATLAVPTLPAIPRTLAVTAARLRGPIAVLALVLEVHSAVAGSGTCGTFSDATEYDVPAIAVATADLDGDGDLDIATANGHVQILLNACPSSCREDLDGSGAVDVGDLLAVLAVWGPCGGECPEDLDGSGAVGVGDLLIVLAAWGPCE